MSRASGDLRRRRGSTSANRVVPAAGKCDCGAAVPEFLMVSIVLIALLMCVLQIGVYAYVHNIITSSAAEGARAAADRDAPIGKGEAVTRQIVGSTLSRQEAATVNCTTGVEPGQAGTTLVALHCRATVPLMMGWLGTRSGFGVDVTQRTIKED